MAKESLLPKFEPMTLSQFFKKIGQDFSNLPPVTTAPVPTRTQSLPMGAGSYQTPSGQPNMSIAPNQSVAPKPINVPLKDVASGKAPVVQPKISTPSGGAPAPTKTTIPPAWINPETGGFYTPEEIANNIAKSAPGARAGDVPKFAGDTLTQGPQTTEKLMMDAATLNNARNDIRVGETDPYKVGSESGIAYTPAELAAVEKAYAGIYDPAINSALAKLEAKQREDEAERERKARLDELALQHKYDMELKRTPSGDNSRTTSGGEGYGGDEFAATVDMVANMEPTVTGQKTLRNQLRSLIDSKDYASAYNQIANSVEKQLVGESKQRFVNARTDYSVLQGMKEAVEAYKAGGGDMGLLKGTEEQIKRKLGINSGEASALATQLWREFQIYRNQMTGAAFGAEESRDYASVNPSLGKSLDLNLNVIQGAQDQLRNRVVSTIDSRVPSAQYIREYAEGVTPQNNSNVIPAGTDGAAYGFPGYVSDGNQWVEK